jgi:hypothetical protein
MNHFCTYFDSGFMAQGLALWASLRRHEPEAVLWVLALDEAAAERLLGRGEANLRVVRLPEVESGDVELMKAKGNRSCVEYYFTLSPCWPLWLFRRNPGMGAVTYVDADMFFFSSPQPIIDEVEKVGASVGIGEHRYPKTLGNLEKWGRFNVGVQYFRNDERGWAVLEDWRARCLEWCYDRVEGDRFADQKYLDTWPKRFGSAVHIYQSLGINAAPWNWMGNTWTVEEGVPVVAGARLVVFHFAKFRSLGGGVWDSGQLDFAVMPRWLRVQIYEPYEQALNATVGGHSVNVTVLRSRRMGARAWVLRVCFGSVWWRAGGRWFALGIGPLGRHSGEWLQRWRGKKEVA